MRALKGDPSTPADEADVKLVTKVKDVLRRSDLTDYDGRDPDGARRAGDRQEQHPPSRRARCPEQGSFTLGWTVPCRKTGVTTRGGDCVLGTTADALVPGMVKEGARAIWQMDQVRVFDGGADSDADTAADNRLFFVQGVFVP